MTESSSFGFGFFSFFSYLRSFSPPSVFVPLSSSTRSFEQSSCLSLRDSFLPLIFVYFFFLPRFVCRLQSSSLFELFRPSSPFSLSFFYSSLLLAPWHVSASHRASRIDASSLELFFFPRSTRSAHSMPLILFKLQSSPSPPLSLFHSIQYL